MRFEDLENAEAGTETLTDLENQEEDLTPATIEDNETPGEEEDLPEAKDEEEETEFVVQIGEDDPEDDEDDEDAPQSKTFRELRTKLKQAQREKKEYERQLKAREKKEVEDQLPPLGERPKLEDFDYDEDAHIAAVEEFLQKKRKHDELAEKAEKKQKEMTERYQSKLQTYEAKKSEIIKDVPDFDDAEDAMLQAFDITKQGILVSVTRDPTVLVLALHQNPKQLEKLANIENPVEYTAELVRLEESLTVKGRTSKPQPERRPKRGSATSGGVSDTQLEALEREAERTGDRTKILAYKRDLKKQNNAR
jgi:hypothetical protein